MKSVSLKRMVAKQRWPPKQKNAPPKFCEAGGASSPEKTRIKCLIWLLVIVVVAVIPVLFCLPAMLSPVPPLVVLIPATLPFGIQVATPILGFPAVVSMIVNGSIQPRFSALDGVLALCPVIVGVYQGHSHKPGKRRH
jgi:hypothetical protein